MKAPLGSISRYNLGVLEPKFTIYDGTNDHFLLSDALLAIDDVGYCISPDIPFFRSLAKKPSTSMDDFFKYADKYAMLEDDVRVASQQIMVTSRAIKYNEAWSSKPSSDQLRQGNWRQKGQQ
ncbi:hypothetical protein AAG906_017253 [Vitis piasezkii]